MIGFAKTPAKHLGALGALIGATSGGMRPQQGESRAGSAMKQGIISGIGVGLGTGLILGNVVKHGDKALEYLKKTMKVI
jgi:hypothetical protein